MSEQEAVDLLRGRVKGLCSMTPSVTPFPVDASAHFLVAKAQVVGWLDDAQDEADLLAAAEHCDTCVRIGLFRKRLIAEYTARIFVADVASYWKVEPHEVAAILS